MKADTLPLVSDDVSPQREDTGPGGGRVYDSSTPQHQPTSPSPYEQTVQFGAPQPGPQQWSPTSGAPDPGLPGSGPPHQGYPDPGMPSSGPPHPGYPGSGMPSSGPPHPGYPSSGGPGYPSSGPPSSGAPWQTSGPPDQYGLDPVSPDIFSAPPFGQRRIEPTPKPARSKLLLGLLIGAAAGVLVAGTAGFFLGRGTAGDDPPRSGTVAEPARLAELRAANGAKFTGELATLAGPWLADMSGCAADTEAGGPELSKGQQAHVLCRDGGMYIHFVTYTSADSLAADRDYRRQLALASQAIIPGVEQSGRKLGGVTGAAGTYVEYGVRPEKQQALCGVWWDLDNSSSAVYVDVLCDTLGGKWDPLRGVWERHS